jgi:hypothetical protein
MKINNKQLEKLILEQIKLKEELAPPTSLSPTMTTTVVTQLTPEKIKTINTLVDTALKSTDLKTVQDTLKTIKQMLK